MREQGHTSFIMKVVGVGVAVIAVILIAGTWWMGQSAQRATETAVRSVSMFYLNELTGRREQVVETNLQNKITDMRTAIDLMTPDDLSDMEHLQAYQAKMKQLYTLDKFAFVDANGLIYTSQGTQDNIGDYDFDYRTITGPDISVKDSDGDNKKAIIAVPTGGIPFGDQQLVVCFMEIDMQQMIEGLSLLSDTNNTTFCNIYTSDGAALTDMVLGGLASEGNLLDALASAEFDEGYSLEGIVSDFDNRLSGIATFTYNGINETLDYVPVTGTDWMLTYLIRESVITDQISGISRDLTLRSILQTLVAALVMLAVFAMLFAQMRRSAQLTLEKETFETETRVKQQEMERRLALQEQLLEQEKQRAQQDKMITALASDYRSVYYIDLDADEGVCYQANEKDPAAPAQGDRFSFSELLTEYAEKYVADKYRQGFLDFIEPASIRAGLESEDFISHRYLVMRDGVEYYEMLRMAGVRHPKDRDDHIVHAVGLGFADVDRETRDQLAQSRALSDALAVAEEASKAKTAFLSNMSHEIRTPMNAIIGLDSIALADEGISDKTREYLEKIGESARHLLGLINDILDVSRIESGRMTIRNESFSFSKLVEQVNTIIGGQCSSKGLNYRCQVKGQVDDSYIGDDTKLRQVLINILGNAVKFTPEGGDVDFGIERIAHYEGHSTLRFTMSDTGIGMDEEFLPKIFEAFAQENSATTNELGSTGLGMAITKSIVELMNGTIEVKSTKGEGSTFIVTVTLGDADGAPDGLERAIDPDELSVLIVDDDPVACEHAKLVLETVGISSEMAGSGAEAVEMVRLRHARQTAYNLILVDWKMPDMDGVETTRQIRAIVGDDSAIIILTAYNWDDILEEASLAGVDCFIAKPLFAANVLEEFQEALKRKGMLDGNDDEQLADLTGRRILLAEDVFVNAQIMKELMKTKDVQVEHADNGRIAVDMFAASEPGHYDAILMDIRMPEMDGLEATAAIRAMDRADAKDIPIIALTANAFDEDVQQSLQAGLNAHLSKPIEPDNLFMTLRRFIRDDAD